MDDLIQEFLVESNENLDRLDVELVKLEAEPGSSQLLASIFRTIHSMKGACGFLGFQKLERLAHAGENLLSKMRDGHLRLSPEIGSTLLTMVDAIRKMLNEISKSGSDGENDYAGLLETLKKLNQEPSEGDPAIAVRPLPAAPQTRATATKDGSAGAAAGDSESHAKAPRSKKKFQPDGGRLGGMLVDRQKVTADDLARALEAQEQGDLRPLGEILVSLGAIQPKELADALRLLEETRAARGAQDSTIRVNVKLLDRLMNLVGELVLARNQVLQFAAQQNDPAFLGTTQQLNLVTSELRENVMKTRMQPISRLFDKVPRVVRDVSVACGKQARVETEGKDTELDRTLIEAINDPLTHLVRNAIDHGIESPEKRSQAGKSAEGTVRLRALHEGGQVTIEISDDGAGIDVEKIRAKAVEKGTISKEQAARLSATEALNLIFLPGVSTAEKVTNVSGRGVGMDVVKTNIERVGGSVEIQTKPGEGSTFKVKVPLTLAIVPALVVRSAGKRFAIPQVNLVELVRLEDTEGGTQNGIELVHDAPVYRLRGKLLPLVYLDRELRLAATSEKGRATNIVVLQVDNRRFGLVVDDVHDTEEIVVKPLSKHLKGIRVYAGATIMGDGKLALILDVPGLAESAGIKSESHDADAASATPVVARDGMERQRLVLFKGSGGLRMALPLSALSRLEKLSGGQVERSGNQWVAQYRDRILPLVRLHLALGDRPSVGGEGDESPFPPGELDVLVLQDQGVMFGLVVEEIVDIVEETVAATIPATRPGVLFSAIIGDRVTEMLDVAGLRREGERKGQEKPRAMGAGA